MFPANTPGQAGTSDVSLPAQVLSNEQYEHNQARLNHMQQVLDRWKTANEQGHSEFLRLQNEMMQLVAAGEQAKLMLGQLSRAGGASLPTIDSSLLLLPPVPSTSGGASIVELPSAPSKSREPISPTSSVPQTRTTSRQTASRGRRGSRARTQMPVRGQPRTLENASQLQQQMQMQVNPGAVQPRALSSQQGTHILPYYPGSFHASSLHPMPYPKSTTSSLDGALGITDPHRLDTRVSQPGSAQRTSTRPVSHQATVTPSASSSRVGIMKSQPSSATATAIETTTSARAPPVLAKDVSSVPKLPHLAHTVPQNVVPSSASAIPSVTKSSSSASKPSFVNAGGVEPAKDRQPASQDINHTPQEFIAVLDDWRRTSPVKSYLELHEGSHTSFYKGANGQVQMFSVKPGLAVAIPQGVDIDYRYQIMSSPDKQIFWAALVSAPHQSVPTSLTQTVNPQTTPASSSSNVTTSVPPAISAATSEGTSQPLPVGSLASSSASIGDRTPAQADKTRLAKDILRSLGTGKIRQRSPRKGQAEGSNTLNFEQRLEDAGAGPASALATHGVQSTTQLIWVSESGRDTFVPIDAVKIHENRAQSQGSLLVLPRDDVDLTRHEAHSVPTPQASSTTNFTINPPKEQKPATDQSPTPPFAIATISNVPSIPANQDASFRASNWVLASHAARPADDVQQPSTEVATASAAVEPIQVNRIGDNRSHSTGGPPMGKNRESPPVSPSLSFAYKTTEFPQKSSKEPLFLPSPNGSPMRQNMDMVYEREQDYEYVGQSGDAITTLGPSGSRQGKAKRQKSQAYVLVPPLPEWAKRMKKQRMSIEEPARKRRKLHENGSAVENRSVTKGGALGSRANDVRPMDPIELKALKESYSALGERSCKWKACEAVLNATESLRRHVLQHVDNDKSSVYSCLWAQCTKRFSDRKEMFRHVNQHASPLFCAYADCEESFRRPKDLVQHNQKQHQNSQLRLLVTPYVPRMPPSMGHLPPTLPAHLIEPRDIRKPNISDERHVALGEWTLRNICGPVDVGPKRMGEALDTGYYDYDFLRSGSRVPSVLSQMDDLQSSVASLLINDGMIFWGSEDPEADNWDVVSKELEAELAAEEEDPTGTAVTSDAVPALEIEPDGNVGNVRSTSVGLEEEAVAVLLTNGETEGILDK